jgi:hypothetical protein
VTPSGITPPARGDDASKIQAAIKACAAGQFVQLGSGTFQLDITENIWLNKGIVLRGTGSCTNASSPYCSTVINTYNGPLANYASPAVCGVSGAGTTCPNPSAGLINVGPASGPYGYGWTGYAAAPTDIDPSKVNAGAKLAADVAQGATTVQVASTVNFSVGGWVLIDEAPALVSTTHPTGGANVQASPEWLNTSGSPAVMRMAKPDGGCTYGFCTDRDNGELHLVKAFGAGPCPGTACTLTFDDPLTIAFRQSGGHDARVYWPTLHSANRAQPFITRAGVEIWR